MFFLEYILRNLLKLANIFFFFFLLSEPCLWLGCKKNMKDLQSYWHKLSNKLKIDAFV